MAALFEMWPKKGLFYVIIGHVVIQKKINNNFFFISWQPGFVFFFFPVFYYYYDTLNFFLCQNAWSREIGWR